MGIVLNLLIYYVLIVIVFRSAWRSPCVSKNTFSTEDEHTSHIRTSWMGKPGANDPRGKWDWEKNSGCWDCIHIHPHRPASAVELRLCRTVLASAEPFLARLVWNHSDWLELSALTAHVVAPRLCDWLPTGAPVVNMVLFHVLDVWAQLGGEGHRFIGEPPWKQRQGQKANSENDRKYQSVLISVGCGHGRKSKSAGKKVTRA